MGAEKGMRFPSVLEPTPTRPRGETGACADGSASAVTFDEGRCQRVARSGAGTIASKAGSAAYVWLPPASGGRAGRTGNAQQW